MQSACYYCSILTKAVFSRQYQWKPPVWNFMTIRLAGALFFMRAGAQKDRNGEFSSRFSQLWEPLWNYVYQCEKIVSFKSMIFWVVLLNDFVRWVWSFRMKWLSYSSESIFYLECASIRFLRNIWYPFKKLRGITFQKTMFLIPTAGQTTNLMSFTSVWH
jgi:hypothetical protein